MKTILINKTQDNRALNPCQLKKKFGSGIIKCSFDCAITNECPIFYIDANDNPIIAKKQ